MSPTEATATIRPQNPYWLPFTFIRDIRHYKLDEPVAWNRGPALASMATFCMQYRPKYMISRRDEITTKLLEHLDWQHVLREVDQNTRERLRRSSYDLLLDFLTNVVGKSDSIAVFQPVQGEYEFAFSNRALGFTQDTMWQDTTQYWTEVDTSKASHSCAWTSGSRLLEDQLTTLRTRWERSEQERASAVERSIVLSEKLKETKQELDRTQEIANVAMAAYEKLQRREEEQRALQRMEQALDEETDYA